MKFIKKKGKSLGIGLAIGWFIVGIFFTSRPRLSA